MTKRNARAKRTVQARRGRVVTKREAMTRSIAAILGDLLAACQELEYYAPDRLQDPELLARVSEQLPSKWRQLDEPERYAVVLTAVADAYFHTPKRPFHRRTPTPRENRVVVG